MTSSILQPVVQETTPALIARQLRRAIGEGDLVPGQQLNEAELSRRLGVSRGPLREAMQRSGGDLVLYRPPTTAIERHRGGRRR